jgi:tetratricopeptide (TPR) repeat protein
MSKIAIYFAIVMLAWQPLLGQEKETSLVEGGSQPELASEILQRMDIDQAARMKWVEFSKAGNQTGADREKEGLRIAEEVSQIDEENRDWLKKVVAQHGWLGKSLVGKRASHAAWLLVQHADGDLQFQKDCLEKMKACPLGEVAPIDIGYLTDRVLVAENQPQVYGTQCQAVNGDFQPKPCIDPEQLDERRKSIGLEPIKDYLEQMRKMYTAAPEDSHVELELPPLPDEEKGLEGVSLLGVRLFRPEQSDQPDLKFEEARRHYEAEPSNVENAIWFGRRLAYQGRFREAIRIYSAALSANSQDPRLYRHRGHRWISIRQFDHAIADLERAAELIANQPDQVEPDGQPNSANIPTSTLQTNIWYHLGLARYLTGDYPAAIVAYENCLAASKNDDMRVAAIYWKYLALRRAGEQEAAEKLIAEVTPEMQLLENHAYQRLILLFRRLIQPDDLRKDMAKPVDEATIRFGLSQYYWLNGQADQAREELERISAEADQPGRPWAAFGAIAAEAELARLRAKK